MMTQQTVSGDSYGNLHIKDDVGELSPFTKEEACHITEESSLSNTQNGDCSIDSSIKNGLSNVKTDNSELSQVENDHLNLDISTDTKQQYSESENDSSERKLTNPEEENDLFRFENVEDDNIEYSVTADSNLTHFNITNSDNPCKGGNDGAETGIIEPIPTSNSDARSEDLVQSPVVKEPKSENKLDRQNSDNDSKPPSKTDSPEYAQNEEASSLDESTKSGGFENDSENDNDTKSAVGEKCRSNDGSEIQQINVKVNKESDEDDDNMEEEVGSGMSFAEDDEDLRLDVLTGQPPGKRSVRPQTTSTLREVPNGLRAKANTPASFYTVAPEEAVDEPKRTDSGR